MKKSNTLLNWIALIAIYALIAFGCKAKKIIIDNSSHATDTVRITQTERIEVKVKDTVIVTDTAIVEFHDTIDCPNANASIERNNGNAQLSLNIKNGKLTAKCKCDSLEVLVRNLREVNSYVNNELSKAKNSFKTETKEVPVIKYKYRYPWWWWLPILYVLGNLLWKYRNPIKLLIKKLLP